MHATQRAGQELRRKERVHRNCQPELDALFEPLRARAQRLDLRQDDPHVAQQCLARGREHRLVAGTVEEPHLELFLEIGNGMAHGRLHPVQPGRAGTEAAGIRHGNEHLHLAQREDVQHDLSNRLSWPILFAFIDRVPAAKWRHAEPNRNARRHIATRRRAALTFFNALARRGAGRGRRGRGVLQVGKVAIAVPQLRTDFGLDLSMVGWLMATFSLLGVVGAVPVGAWVARAGDRRLLVAGLLAIAVGSTAGAWAQGIAMLLIGRVVEGLGFVLITIAGPSVLQRMVAPGGKDLAFAIWSCFMPAGIAIALFSGSLPGGWRGLWLGNAALAALIAVLVLAGVSRGASANTREAPVPWRSMARDAAATAKAGAPALIAASFVIYSLQFFALFSFLPVLLIERMGVGTATAGQLSAAACCVNVAGNLAAGMLLQRGIARWLLAALASALMGIASIGIFLPVLGAVPAFVLCLVFRARAACFPQR